MSQDAVKKDPVKLHKQANNLYELGKYNEAKEAFLEAAELYKKSNNFFDSTSMLYKAGECEYMLKNFKIAVEYFLKSAELSFQKGFERFGVSALEYVRDCYSALGLEEQVREFTGKIAKVKAKLKSSF